MGPVAALQSAQRHGGGTPAQTAASMGHSSQTMKVAAEDLGGRGRSKLAFFFLVSCQSFSDVAGS